MQRTGGEHTGAVVRSSVGRALASGLVALAAFVGTVSCSTSWPNDPGRPDFLIGMSRESDGSLHLWMGNCLGSAARRIVVSQDGQAGSPIWTVTAEGGGTPLVPASPLDVRVGDAPAGMATSLWRPLSDDQQARYSVSVNFTDFADASVGGDADLRASPDGMIVSHDSRYTIEQFGHELRRLCG